MHRNVKTKRIQTKAASEQEMLFFLLQNEHTPFFFFFLSLIAIHIVNKLCYIDLFLKKCYISGYPLTSPKCHKRENVMFYLMHTNCLIQVAVTLHVH